MTLSLQINAEAEARLRQLAAEAGQDMNDFVSSLIDRVANSTGRAGPRSSTDFDQALDELFAADTRRLPAVPLTFSRNDIYIDHD